MLLPLLAALSKFNGLQGSRRYQAKVVISTGSKHSTYAFQAQNKMVYDVDRDRLQVLLFIFP